MGYDMTAVKDHEVYFRANISGMQFLRTVIGIANVDMTKKVRHTERAEKGEKPYSRKGDILTCFSTNDGWHVTSEDCKELATKVATVQAGQLLPDPVPDPAMQALVGKLVEAGMAPTQAPQFEQEMARGPLSGHHITREEKAYIDEFAKFCEKSVTLGGFHVW